MRSVVGRVWFSQKPIIQCLAVSSFSAQQRRWLSAAASGSGSGGGDAVPTSIRELNVALKQVRLGLNSLSFCSHLDRAVSACEQKGLSGAAGGELQFSGWVKSARPQKHSAFVNISDGSTLDGLQIVCDPKLAKQ